MLSANVSPLQLRKNTLAEKIRGLCAEAAYPMERLKLEITETALAENLEQARAIVGHLKDMGCRISLDDFGTGYSSLLHLHSLPFDEIKVDRSFVMSMTERRESRKIAAAVVGLGQSLGMATVAEGVERQEQADMLLWLGCDMAQGWLYGEPLSPQKLQEAVEQSRRGSAQERPIRRTIASASGLDTMRFGETRGQQQQPLKSLLDAGIPVALGSDGPNNPYLNIVLASTYQRRPSEAITREQAVMAYTLTAAYAEFAEKDKGSLEPGKLADLAVLSHDIFTVPPPDLLKTESVLTLVGGKVVYDAKVIGER